MDTPAVEADETVVDTSEDTFGLVKVNVASMNFRTKPSASSDPVADCPVLYFGAVLEVHEESGEWYRVEDMYGHRGWARAEYEGNVYLEPLPNDYLETHVTAREAYERAKPIADKWAEDTYLTQIGTPLFKYIGWNGLADEWVCAFCSPTEKVINTDRPYDFVYLEVTVGPDGTRHKEIAQLDGFAPGGPRIVTVKEATTDFIDSDELFAPEKVASFRSKFKSAEYLADFVDGGFIDDWFAADDANSLYLNGETWSIQGHTEGHLKEPCIWLGPLIELDAVSGSIEYFE
jgi:hypothetical protein